MKKIMFLCAAMVVFSTIVSAQSKPSTYSMSCGIENDSLHVAVWCYWDTASSTKNYALLSQYSTILVIDDEKEVPYKRYGDTIELLERHDVIRFVYTIPWERLRTIDGVIDLRREDNWYPNRNDEVEYIVTSMWADGYHAILNGELLGVDVKEDEEGIYYAIPKKYDGLHLILVPKK